MHLPRVQPAHGHVEGDVEVLGRGLQQLPVVAGLVFRRPAGDGALAQGQVLVGHHQVGVDLLLDAQPLAIGAGAVGRVEAEGARLDGRDARAVVGAVEVFGVERIAGVGRVGDVVDDDDALAQAQRRLDGVGQAAAVAGGFLAGVVGGVADDQAVDDGLDGVVLVAIQLDLVVHLAHFAVDAHADEAGLAHVVEDALVLALAVLHQRGQHLDARPGGHGQHVADDLLRRLGHHRPAAHRAMGRAHAGEEQAQVVVDLRHRAHRRARVVADALLVDGHRRAKALDVVDVGLLHLPQELPGVGRQRFDVAALALGEDGVEGQRRLARPRQAGDDHQLVARDLDVDVLEVVLARAAHDDLVQRHTSVPVGAEKSHESLRATDPQ